MDSQFRAGKLDCRAEPMLFVPVALDVAQPTFDAAHTPLQVLTSALSSKNCAGIRRSPRVNGAEKLGH